MESVGATIPVVVPAPEAAADGVFAHGVPPALIPVRIVRSSELDPKRKDRLEKVLSALSAADWKWLCGVNSLRLGAMNGDEGQIHKAYQALFPHLSSAEVGGHVQAIAELNLATDEVSSWVSEALSRVRLIYWFAGKPGALRQPGVALFCPTFKIAIAVKMLVNSAVRECAHCNAPFLVKRPRQQCCTPKCQSAHRYRRWLARKAKGESR